MLRRRFKRFLARLHEARLSGPEVVIVSDNCWGIDFYALNQRVYSTPFIGLFLYPGCFLKLLEGFPAVLREPLRFVDRSRYRRDDPPYPVGLLGDEIEIHFLHYLDRHEALDKWNRRVSRLLSCLRDGAPVCLKMDDRDGASLDQLMAFHRLHPDLRKISFAAQPLPGCVNHILVEDLLDSSGVQVSDGLSLYGGRYRYFDFVEWVRSGRVRVTVWSRLLALFS